MRPQPRASLVQASVRAHCKQLRVPTMAAQFERFAEEAVKQQQSHIAYLDALSQAELDERERRLIERRLWEARLPRMKTLENFNFADAPHLPVGQIRELAQGSYIERTEPVIFLGESGTGKTHLASALVVEACRHKRRARFTTAAGLVNELVEAQHHNQLGRALARWSRYELIAIDEVGYVPLVEVGAELLFQVISERAERATLIVTTNLPFSEWTQIFNNARLCKAAVDRVTDRAHIIETGTESYRFKRTMEARRQKKKKA